MARLLVKLCDAVTMLARLLLGSCIAAIVLITLGAAPLLQALGRDDHEAVRHVVHTLQSSSASVGALELSRCCSEIENRLRAHQVDGLAQMLSRLDAEGERVLAAVRDLLAP